MKYTAKFEEMIDARKQGIDNCNKIINEQKDLVEYLSATEETKKKFKPLIDALNKEMEEKDKTIKTLEEANKNTLFIVDKLKKCNTETSRFIEQIIKEIGIFETTPPAPAPEPAPVEEPKDEKEQPEDTVKE